MIINRPIIKIIFCWIVLGGALITVQALVINKAIISWQDSQMIQASEGVYISLGALKIMQSWGK